MSVDSRSAGGGTVLEVTGASKVFGGRHGVTAVQEASLIARPGEFIAIVGESGSGKSTLARMLLGLIPPTSGGIALDGVDLRRMDPTQRRGYRRTVQAVLQDPAGSLNPRKTVRKALADVIRRHAIASRKDMERVASAALESVGLFPASAFLDRYPHELSGGQRQRVLIARALVLDPRIIIADEAVSALDASVKAGVLRVMTALQAERGIGYVFITHDLPVVQKVADTVYVMRAGRIVEHGPKKRIFEDPQHEYTRTLLAAAPRL
ncbi:ABC transporter ATP-binding protein [Microbacterium caowuchunii]|uniref:ABC transporter ATP-binding protein n=1 Tax=Microbacterium caowuchunii TaxID=2614638 RepID=UPI001CD7A2D8|nr:ABC transporter ATP-binding protein [Microbacterium caowuchunii]